MGLLGAIFTFAVERGFRTDNPTTGVRKFPVGKRERFLTREELPRLGNALREAEQNGMNPGEVNAILLLLLTGCRRGEVINLEWPHVDMERACLRLLDSKTGAKVVHLRAAAMELLAAQPHIQGTPFVFPGTIHGPPPGGPSQILAGHPGARRTSRPAHP
ncbi:MAG: tyrosine-type recombinase/integrase [Magnetococcus sp. WYHC-3]